MGEFILEWKELEAKLALARKDGKRIISTNGVFDILHVGHVRYLQAARALGDILVIGINSDDSTRRLKGPGRPVNSERDRAEIIAALACVDFVTLFEDSTPIRLLEVIQPSIHAKGGDYEPDQMPESPVVKAGGGKIVTLPFVVGQSTTRLIDRIHDSHSRNGI